MVLYTTSYAGRPTRSSADGQALVPRQAKRVASARTTLPKRTVRRIRSTRSIAAPVDGQVFSLSYRRPASLDRVDICGCRWYLRWNARGLPLNGLRYMGKLPEFTFVHMSGRRDMVLECRTSEHLSDCLFVYAVPSRQRWIETAP